MGRLGIEMCRDVSETQFYLHEECTMSAAQTVQEGEQYKATSV